jgi:hypothetical protein
LGFWNCVTDAVWSGENNGSANGVLYPQQPLTSPGTYTNSFTTPGGATGTSVVQTKGLPYPSISISVQTSGVSNDDSIVAVPQAELDYYFTVIGPGPGAIVDFTSNARLTYPVAPNTEGSVALSVDGASWFAQVQVSDAFGVYYNSEPPPPGFDPNSFTLQGGIYATTDQNYEVKMSASVVVEATDQGPATMNAYIDPHLFIDPSTPNADQYSIVTSLGIGNALPSSVPEPSTWAMMLVGFAGLGFGARRRIAAVSVV